MSVEDCALVLVVFVLWCYMMFVVFVFLIVDGVLFCA